MIPIVGADAALERKIRQALSSFPAWFVRGARISRIEVSRRAEVREQIACYHHGSRVLYLWAGVGDLLQKALGHELAHGCDDNFGNPHYFTSSPEWHAIHKNQAYFDLPKYAEQPLEHFADMVVKVLLLGSTKLSTTNPAEVHFITTWFFPVMVQEFSNV